MSIQPQSTFQKAKSVEKLLELFPKKEKSRNSLSLPKLNESLIIPENILKLVSSDKKSVSTKLSNTKNSRRDISKSITNKKTKNKDNSDRIKSLKKLLKSVKNRKKTTNSISPLKNKIKKNRLKSLYDKTEKSFKKSGSKKVLSTKGGKKNYIVDKILGRDRSRKSFDFQTEKERFGSSNLIDKGDDISEKKKFTKLRNLFKATNTIKKTSKNESDKNLKKNDNSSHSPTQKFTHFKKFRDNHLSLNTKKTFKGAKRMLKNHLNLGGLKNFLKNPESHWKNKTEINIKYFDKSSSKDLKKNSIKKSESNISFSKEKMNQTMSFFNNPNELKKFEKFNKTSTQNFFSKKKLNRSLRGSSFNNNSNLLSKLKIQNEKFKKKKDEYSKDIQKNLKNQRRVIKNLSLSRNNSIESQNFLTNNMSKSKKSKKEIIGDNNRDLKFSKFDIKSKRILEKLGESRKKKKFEISILKNKRNFRKSERFNEIKNTFLRSGDSRAKNKEYLKEQDLNDSSLNTLKEQHSITKKYKKMKKFLKYNKLLTSPDDLNDENDSKLDELFMSMITKENRDSALSNTMMFSESILETNHLNYGDNGDEEIIQKITERYLFEDRKYYIDDLRDFILGIQDEKNYLKGVDYEYHKRIFLEHFKQSFYSLRKHRIPKSRQNIEGILDCNIEISPSKVKYLPNLLDKEKKTLVLDLDETLIHCFTVEEYPWDYRIKIPQIDGTILNRKKKAKLCIRPYAKKFLENMSKQFEIILFTASEKYYADTILEYLDPERKYISHRFYRESCSKVKKTSVKDLRVIGNRDPTKLIIVDNSTTCFLSQLHNGIPIIPFYFKEDDFELVKLERFLTDLSEVDHDVRNFLYNHFHLELFLEVEDINELINRLLFRR